MGGVDIAIVSPGYPAARGGVTDHTTRLVRHWSEAGHRVEVLGSATVHPGQTVATWREHRLGAILIQYVPFLYGRRGLSSFPRRVVELGRAAGLRTCVFVHEPWVPPRRLPWVVLSPLQRRQLVGIVKQADVVATPVPAWRDMLGGKVSLVYVGSTLGDPAPRAPEGPPLASPVVFSPFASGLNWDWIVAAVRAVGSTSGLTVIGGDWVQARAHPILGRWADPTWDWRGRLDGREVLPLLARARLVLAPFHDGLTGRRTSAFAAASVGAPLLSSRGHLFDPAFEEGPFALANTKHEFAEKARALFWQPESPEARGAREGRVAWYDRHMAPADLDRGLLELVAGAPA